MNSIRLARFRNIEAALLVGAALVLLSGTCLRIAAIPSDPPRPNMAVPRGNPAVPNRPAIDRPAASRLQWRSTALLLIAFFVVFLLKRRFRPRSDPFLLPSAALLASTGNLAISGCKDPFRDGPAMVHHAEGILFAAIAGVIAGGPWTFRRPLHRYGYVAALSACFLLLLLAAAGRGPGGVRLSVLGFQPAEIVKVLYVVFTAAYLAARGGGSDVPVRLSRSDTLPLLVMLGIPVGLFVLLRDLGPVLVMVGAILAMATVATHRGRWMILGSLGFGGAGLVACLLGVGTLPTRVGMWWSPWGNAFKGGDHLATALWTAASGGWFGAGIGLAETRLLPRAGSDMILPSIIGDGGVPAGIAAIAAAAIPAWRALRIWRLCPTRFESLLAVGLGIALSLQAALIAGGSLGLVPLSGVSLPWSAYGTSALVAQGVGIAILIALSDREHSEMKRTEGAPVRFLAVLHGSVFLLLALRCLQLTGVLSDTFAVHAFVGRGRNGSTQRRTNPRLNKMALELPRGTLVDRNGTYLAMGTGTARTYPLGEDAAFATGWLSPSTGLGEAHAERDFDRSLRGWTDERELLRIWRNRRSPLRTLTRPALVELGLDSKLQRRAAVLLRETPTRRGAIYLLDSATQTPLVNVSLPAMNPSSLANSALRRSVLPTSMLDRAADGKYTPGSTFKIITAAALLKMGRGDFTVECRHESGELVWQGDGRRYRRRSLSDDRNEGEHGQIGLERALAVSCNVYFARAAIYLGAERLMEMTSALGLPTPDAESVRSSLPDTGIGQGELAVSPRSMAEAVRRILRASHGSPGSTGLESADAARVINAMVLAVEDGTATRSALPGRRIGAKTGTAQTGGGNTPHAWIVGFEDAPGQSTVFAILVENAGYGGGTAAPIARSLLEEMTRTR